jgi:hypothetical protein
MGRVYDTTHNLFGGVSILLIWGGLFAFFTQSRYPTGFMGVDPQKHGRGMGITMFFSGVVLAVINTVIAGFTNIFADVNNPLRTLDYAIVSAVTSNDSLVLRMRVFGLYFQWVGFFLIFGGIVISSMAGSVHGSGAKTVFMSFIGGLLLILIGAWMARWV